MLNIKNDFGEKSYTDLKTSFDLSNSGDQNHIQIKDLPRNTFENKNNFQFSNSLQRYSVDQVKSFDNANL
jgi:hypothetical protein